MHIYYLGILYIEHRSWSVSWFRQLSTLNSYTLQTWGVTSIFGVRRWNQVQNERAQCPHFSTFLKKCSDQNWRYAPRKTCIDRFGPFWHPSTSAPKTPIWAQNAHPKPVHERNGGVECRFRYTEAGFNDYFNFPSSLRVNLIELQSGFMQFWRFQTPRWWVCSWHFTTGALNIYRGK